MEFAWLIQSLELYFLQGKDGDPGFKGPKGNMGPMGSTGTVGKKPEFNLNLIQIKKSSVN